MSDKVYEYAQATADAILSLFKDEEDGGNPNYHYDLAKIDGTEFFTGLIMGCNAVYQRLTGDEKNNLEFTYLMNQLIVQHMLKNKDLKIVEN